MQFICARLSLWTDSRVVSAVWKVEPRTFDTDQLIPTVPYYGGETCHEVALQSILSFHCLFLLANFCVLIAVVRVDDPSALHVHTDQVVRNSAGKLNETPVVCRG